MVTKLLSSPPINLLNSKFLLLDGVDTRVYLTEFAQNVGRKNAEVKDICFTLLDAGDIRPSFVLNQNVEERDR